MNKKTLTEQEIRTQYITPAIRSAGLLEEAAVEGEMAAVEDSALPG